MRKKKIGFLPVLCLIALTAGVTYAAVVWFIDVPMSFDIVSGYSLALYEEDEITPLTAFDLGEISTGDGGQGGIHWIENIGSAPVYISFSLADWPSEVLVAVQVLDDGGTPLDLLYPDDTPLGPLDPGIKWYCSINYVVDPLAVLGPYSPTFTWNSHEAP